MTHLLLFEPYAGGHQAEFLTWLAEAWARRGAPGGLVVAAPPTIAQGRPALEAACNAPGVQLVAIEPPTAGRSGRNNTFSQRRVRSLRHVLEVYDPVHVLLMSFESMMAPLAARVRLPGRGHVSALSLRPTLHLSAFETQPAPLAVRAKRWAKARVVRGAAEHPRFHTLFSLDPTATPALRALCPSTRVEGVPDPVPPDPVSLPRDAVRARYGVEPGRHLMVLPGALDSRKGALVVPEALLRLAPQTAARTAVLFAGHIHPSIETAFRALLARVAAETRVQVLLRDTFVPADDIQAHVAAADTVLLLYNAEHVGSSGFLMRAAGARVPVLSTADGLMGALTRRHGLGRTAPLDPDALAVEIAAALDETGFDPHAAAAFAATHTVGAFTQALLTPLLDT